MSSCSKEADLTRAGSSLARALVKLGTGHSSPPVPGYSRCAIFERVGSHLRLCIIWSGLVGLLPRTPSCNLVVLASEPNPAMTAAFSSFPPTLRRTSSDSPRFTLFFFICTPHLSWGPQLRRQWQIRCGHRGNRRIADQLLLNLPAFPMSRLQASEVPLELGSARSCH